MTLDYRINVIEIRKLENTVIIREKKYLMNRLFADNRIADASLAANDEKARKRFYREYGLIDEQDE